MPPAPATRSCRRCTRSRAAASSAPGSARDCPWSAGRLPIPAVHTDFPLAALGEELGLIGILALLGLYLSSSSAGCGSRPSAADEFRALLAAGLSLVVGVQAFIIAAGNLKLIPLTGITLPFISLRWFVAAGERDRRRSAARPVRPRRRATAAAPAAQRSAEPCPRSPRDRVTGRGSPNAQMLPARRPPVGRNISRVGLALVLAFGVLAVGAGYWQVIMASPFSSASDNPAVIAAARNVVRGVIRDRDGAVLATSSKDSHGEPYRVYVDDTVSPVIGYASRQFGTAGLERAYDGQLTGITRPDPLRDLLKKFDPNPYDPQALTLSLSLALQRAAVEGLGKDVGAVVMLDPRTGEVLAMASTPTFNANGVANPTTAARTFAAIRGDARNPLLPRATQGLYTPGSVFKIVTSVAGLGSGAITPSTTFKDQPTSEKNGWLIDGFRVRDGHHPFTGDNAAGLRRGSRGLVQHLVRARRASTWAARNCPRGRNASGSATRSPSTCRRPPRR